MVEDNDASQTPEAFLVDLQESLHSNGAMDADLSKIIIENILYKDPAGDCVNQALTLITKLAKTRASAPNENPNG